MRLLLIAPVCNGEDIGEAWIAFQWAKLLAARYEVTLITYHKRGARPAAEQLKGLRIIEWTEPPLLGRAERFNSIAQPAYIPFYIRARRWIRRALAHGDRFDLAHQPVPVALRYPSPVAGLGIPYVIGPVGGGLSTPAGFAADEAQSAPWFMALRGIDRYRRRWDPVLRRTYQEAACVLGIAPYVRELLDDIPLKRFETMSDIGLNAVHDPIDRSGRSGPVRLLYVGRLVRTKGARDIIHAMALSRAIPTTLEIVGDGPERSVCESLIAEYGLGDRVTIHGWRPKGEVSKFYREADVFVFPSYREPGGSVVLEAMSHSLPLIVVDRGGPGSNVSDACGIKLQVTTPEVLARDIADAIEKLATTPGLRSEMGAAAHIHVTRTALWSTKVDRMAAIFEQDIGGLKT